MLSYLACDVCSVEFCILTRRLPTRSLLIFYFSGMFCATLSVRGGCAPLSCPKQSLAVKSTHHFVSRNWRIRPITPCRKVGLSTVKREILLPCAWVARVECKTEAACTFYFGLHSIPGLLLCFACRCSSILESAAMCRDACISLLAHF